MASTFDFDSLVAVCLRTHEEMQHQAARSVNLSLVVRNWLFGWYIVEYEQNGTDRAEYGTQFIESLSARLRQAGIKGSSRTRLQLFRSFYLNYKQICPTVSGELEPGASLLPPLEICPTVSGEFAMLPYRGERLPDRMLGSLAKAFALSWSHYVTLLTIDQPDERRFYEIEATANHWSVRELERQIASSLYERLALSRDKDEIRRLAQEGQVVETGPADFPNGKSVLTKHTIRPGTLCESEDILVTVKGSGAGTLVVADARYCISRQLMAIKVHDWDSTFIFYS